MSSPDGYLGFQLATSRTSEYNASEFIIRSILSGQAHVAVVKVISVNPGTPLSVGTVDVQPMVNQIDGDGNAVPHGVINGIPWVTLQAGASAVLLQPEVGDRGVCVFADRDISSVKSTRAIANPGSMREADMSDGIYLGGLLNDDPTQWIKMDNNGIVFHSPVKIVLEAPEINLNATNNVHITAPVVAIDASTSTTINTGTFTVNGASQFNGNVNSSGTITAATDVIGNGTSLHNHTHRAQGATAITTPPL